MEAENRGRILGVRPVLTLEEDEDAPWTAPPSRQRKEAPIAMPAWEGNPAVSAHIADLYAYLSARAEGLQGKGRPLP